MPGIEALLLRNRNIRRVGALRAAESRLRSEPYFVETNGCISRYKERKQAARRTYGSCVVVDPQNKRTRRAAERETTSTSST